jgi:hypothetical protein
MCVQNGALGAHRHQDHGGGLNGGTTRRPDERTESAKERTASGLRARWSRQRHLQETASHPVSQRNDVAATRQGALG